MSGTMQEENLINLLDGYVEKGGHHLNVNVFNRETLLDAQRKNNKMTLFREHFIAQCKMF